ncbi:MAG: ribosome hibernation-promoting factor, HPF/YfiA family [Cellulosilyticaceae bacterium]
MKHKIIGRNLEITAALETAVTSHLTKLEKYFNENAEVTVTLSVEKQRHIIEMTIPFNGQILRAEVEGAHMYNIIDDAVAIIERQVTRFKNKLRSKHRNAPVQAFTEGFLENDDTEDFYKLTVDRRKKFAIKPMDAEEAVMQMELLGHGFFVYLDADSEEVNVVYRRKNGTYGLIEPSFE